MAEEQTPEQPPDKGEDKELPQAAQNLRRGYEEAEREFGQGLIYEWPADPYVSLDEPQYEGEEDGELFSKEDQDLEPAELQRKYGKANPYDEEQRRAGEPNAPDE